MDIMASLAIFLVAVVLIAASPGASYGVDPAPCDGTRVASVARSWFGRPAMRRRWELIGGTILIVLGIRVASASRR